jgi:hypothetical protein
MAERVGFAHLLAASEARRSMAEHTLDVIDRNEVEGDGGEGGIRTLPGPLESVSYRNHIAAVAMNAVAAVAHCPPLPANTALDQVCSNSEILNAGRALFLTRRLGSARDSTPVLTTQASACPNWLPITTAHRTPGRFGVSLNHSRSTCRGVFTATQWTWVSQRSGDRTLPGIQRHGHR